MDTIQYVTEIQYDTEVDRLDTMQYVIEVDTKYIVYIIMQYVTEQKCSML